MFRDTRILSRLIIVVFTGMFCVLTLAGAWSLVKRPFATFGRTPVTVSLLVRILFFGCFGALSALLLWHFRIMLRRAHAGEDGDYFGMTRRTWIAILWCSFVVGIGCGCVMFVYSVQ